MAQLRLPGFDQLPEMDEVAVRHLLEHINPHLWAAVANPFDDFLERRANDPAFRILSEGEAAQWLRPQIVHHAKRIFELNDSIVFRQVKQQKLFDYKDLISICFKKVTRRAHQKEAPKLERSNYLTERNKDMWDQRKLDGLLDIPRIIVGYEFIDEMTDIRIIVGYPRTRKRTFRWFYQMDNQNAVLELIAADQQMKAVNIDADEDPGFVIRPRRKFTIGGANNE